MKSCTFYVYRPFTYSSKPQLLHRQTNGLTLSFPLQYFPAVEAKAGSHPSNQGIQADTSLSGKHFDWLQ